MGSLISEDLQATRKRMIEDLINGKEIATRLQTLLRNPVRDEEQRVLFDELALQIWTSFNVNLSVLMSSTMNQIDASAEGSIFSAESKKSPVVKDRRGGYKRRKTCDSWTKVSETTGDGRAWRKYGQKNIMNSEYPRCYYRCTNKYQGCKATKQVQRISKENPLLYQTTYFNQHTCTETVVLGAPTELIVDLDPVEPNLINFKATTVQSKQTHQTPTSATIKKDTQSSGDIICGGNSAMGAYWQEIIMSSYQNDHQVASGFQSCESTSFHGLDDMLEVNQLGDIDNIQFDY